MKTIWACIFLLLVNLNYQLLAQETTNEQPLSNQPGKLKSASAISSRYLSLNNREELLKEDEEFPQPLRYAKSFQISMPITELATIDTLSDGYLLRAKFNTPDAYSIGLLFNEFNLKTGEKLFLYNHNYTKVYGAYTAANNPANDTLALPDFPGNHLILELFTPHNPASVKLTIDIINYAYRDLFELLQPKADTYIDINCPAGDPYQLHKHSVAKMTFTQSGGSYLCSGALINNTAQDGTPYFLTANHCIKTTTVANTLVAYFNYENVDCNGTLAGYNSISGATVKATYFKSDFTLLLLNTTPNNTYQPYYAGWRNDTLASPMSFGIHHPGGAAKKISIDNDPTFSFPYEISWEDGTKNPPYSHWLVAFDAGTTSGGSSGSPLFDTEGRIIGQLHGGGDDYDFYGGLFYSWAKGTLNSTKLKPWLDPGNSGVTNWVAIPLLPNPMHILRPNLRQYAPEQLRKW